MTKILPKGFYTALGTPLDENGNVIVASLADQVRMQIEAGAAGFLVLGTMGIQAYVKQDQGPVAVRAVIGAIDSADLSRRERPALLVGVMDNSIHRVLQRIEALSEFPLDGVVLTTPYYGICGDDALFSFFTKIADQSPFPVYLYDLPGVTKIKIALPLVRRVAEHPNIRGIKTGDAVLTRQIWRNETIRKNFTPVFSGLDIFDLAASYGITHYLDGMFACCPATTRRCFEHFRDGRIEEGGRELDRILDLRDIMFSFGIFPAFSATMNLLGLSGQYGPDYEPAPSEEATKTLRKKMANMGESVI